MTAHHSPQCDWHWDQYDFECNCGATMPRTVACVQSELRSAQARIESDALRCVALKAELKRLHTASGIEAATADETRSGSAEGESPVGNAETPKSPNLNRKG